MYKYDVLLLNEQQTLLLALRLSRIIYPPCIIYLNGDLGVGKTMLAKSFIVAFKFLNIVNSPTYTIVESYKESYIIINHFDLYKINNSEELEFIGIREYIDFNNICLFEWSGNGLGFIPFPDLVINMHFSGKGRRLRITSHSNIGKNILKSLYLGDNNESI